MLLVARPEPVRDLAAEPGAEHPRQPQHDRHRQPRLGGRQPMAADEEADRPQCLAVTEESDDRRRDQYIDERARSEDFAHRSEEHTSELQSLMSISYAVFCLKKKKNKQT